MCHHRLIHPRDALLPHAVPCPKRYAISSDQLAKRSIQATWLPAISYEVKMTHSNKVAKLQEELKNFQTSHTISPLNFRYNTGHSNTTRSKSYKQTGGKLDLEAFNEIIKIDPHKRLALVEPRVTMEQLAKATLAYGLMPPVIPEFKGITVGGAIAGGAAESS